MSIDVGQTHRVAASTAELVQQIAGRVHVIADQAGFSHSAFTDLAAAADALAAQARTSLRAIDCCVGQGVQCAQPGTHSEIAASRLDLATEWIGLLERTLDAVIAIYGHAYSGLADRAALAEEYLCPIPESAGQRLSAALLGQHARALAHGTATRPAI